MRGARGGSGGRPPFLLGLFDPLPDGGGQGVAEQGAAVAQGDLLAGGEDVAVGGGGGDLAQLGKEGEGLFQGQALGVGGVLELDRQGRNGIPPWISCPGGLYQTPSAKIHRGALRAAKLVDPAKDDDVEDLYLVVIGLRAGGDRAGAEAVERIIRAQPATYMARSIMAAWLDHDARWPADRAFTPRHPSPTAAP